jgi:hypothetical protein
MAVFPAMPVKATGGQLTAAKRKTIRKVVLSY